MVKTNSLKAWVLAARPKTLTGAMAPVLVGAAFACSALQQASCSSLLAPCPSFLLCLLFAILMQVDANLINDYFDFRKGTDRADRLGPERACAQGWVTPRAMRWAIGIVTTLSAMAGFCILATQWQWELLIVGTLCIVFSFLYTTHLSYVGWGDLLVIVFFGLVPVVGTYYVMTAGGWNVQVIMAGLAMGLATDNLLMVNNYRDRNQDLVSGKRTIVVRIIEWQKRLLGTEAGQREGAAIVRDIYLWLGIFAAIMALSTLFLWPYSSIRWPLMLIYLILHFRAFRQLCELDGRDLNRVLGLTARNIFLFGLLFAICVFL